jgi:hypothetical protein
MKLENAHWIQLTKLSSVHFTMTVSSLMKVDTLKLTYFINLHSVMSHGVIVCGESYTVKTY